MYHKKTNRKNQVYNVSRFGKALVRGGVLFATVLLLCFSVKTTSHAEREVIKVGAIARNSFIENVDGVYTGYGVEYLELIGEYNDWSYVFVFDTWENCFKRLDNGELDMLCNVQQTEERMEKYLYSGIPLGYDYSIIYAHPDSNIYYEDYENMMGKKVGLMTASIHSASFFGVF